MCICVSGLQLNGVRILFDSLGEESLGLVGRAEVLVRHGGRLDPNGGPVFTYSLIDLSSSIQHTGEIIMGNSASRRFVRYVAQETHIIPPNSVSLHRAKGIEYGDKDNCNGQGNGPVRLMRHDAFYQERDKQHKAEGRKIEVPLGKGVLAGAGDVEGWQ